MLKQHCATDPRSGFLLDQGFEASPTGTAFNDAC